MAADRPPYWYWRADWWKLALALLLILAIVLVAALGPGAPGSQAVKPAFTGLSSAGQLTQDALGDVTGTARAGERVLLFDGEKLLDQTVADGKGEWRLALGGLAPGPHELRVQVVDANGKVLAASAPQAVTVVAVAVTGSETPASAGAPAEATASASGLTPSASRVPVSGGATPAAAQPSPVSTYPAGGGVASEGATPAVIQLDVTPSSPVGGEVAGGGTFTGPAPGSTLVAGPAAGVSGTAPPGARVRLYEGDQLLGEATAGGDGVWRVGATSLPVGPHKLIARASYPDGRTFEIQVTVNVTVSVAPTQPAGSAGCTQWYTVQQGDTLNKIAARTGTTTTYLATLNGLSNPDLIYPGQKLCVSSAGTPSNGTYYTVKQGDTLGSIGARYGWSAAYLAEVNHLANPDQIYPGQVLFIPNH